MSGPCHIFLIPGFLGFTRLGRLPYFREVRACLASACATRGLHASIVEVETLPTSSLRLRAARLADVMQQHAGDDDRPIHLVAHSSGGLDARLLLTPGVSLPVDRDLEPLLARVRSLVTIATPHHGTPLASFFDGMFGQRVLWLLSLCVAHTVRFGRMPLDVVRRGAGLLRGPDPATQAEAIEDLGQALLRELPPDSQGSLVRLFEQIREDQALVPQLTPEGLDVFNAATGDRSSVRYGCIVARARPPGLRSRIRAGASPYAQARFAVFSALHQLTGRMRRRTNGLDPARVAELEQAFGHPLTWADSDGVVPSLSQLQGDLVAAVRADHLDIVGHFESRAHGRRAWLGSGSGFDPEAFATTWGRVAGFIARAQHSAEPRAIARRRPAPWRRALPSVAVGGGMLVAFALYEGMRSSIVGGSMVGAALMFAACVMVGVMGPIWAGRKIWARARARPPRSTHFP